MTAELVRGQNHPLPGNRLEIRVSAGTPVVAAVTLGDEQGRVAGGSDGDGAGPGHGGSAQDAAREWLAHPGAPQLPGVEVPRQAAAEHRLAVDLGAMPQPVHRVHVLLALPPGRPGSPADFGAAPAPYLAVTTPDGTAIAGYTVTGLGPETALLAIELYRRQGAWKVRAVGQGYAGGLPALLLDQGVPEPAAVAAEVHDAVTRERSRSVDAPARSATRPGGAPPRGGPAGGPARSDRPPAGPGAPPPRGTPAGAQADAGGPSAGPGAAPRGGPADGPAGSDRPAARPGAATPQGTAVPGAGPAGSTAPTSAAPDSTAGQPGDSSAAPGGDEAGTAAPSGPVDYRHPRRRPAPVPPATPPAAPPATPTGPATPAAPSAPAAPEPAPAGAGAAGGPPVPVAGDAGGWTMEERLHNQIWGMFEDLARSVAAYRSAEDFAQSRYDQELDALLADPHTRGGPAAEAARDEAMTKQVALVDQARAVLDRDLAQLTAESEVVEPALPPAFAGWESPAWHAYQVPDRPPMAVRLGGLTLPEAPELRIPLLVRLPLQRGLWIDSAEDRTGSMEAAVAIAARLLASHPVGGFAVHALDPAGSGTNALAPLHSGGALVLPPPAAGVAGVSEVLGRLTERVDLLQMALRSGAEDALPPGFDRAQQLLIVNEFPYGFDDRAVTQLRYLADEGPAAGVHLLLVADREDASAYGPVLDPPLAFGMGDPRRSLLRLTPLPSDHLADPWVGHAWTYEPALVPPGSQVVAQVLRSLAAARPAYGM